jgi:acetyl esterase/lipase
MKAESRFLLASAANAATTANALRPVGGGRRFQWVAFGSGLVPSELPVQHGAGQLAFAAVAGRGGGWRRGWRGRAGLALNAASVAGLWHLHRVAGQAGDVLEAALVEELGPDYRDRIQEPFSPAPDVALTRRRVMLPDLTARRRYRAARNVAYGDHGRKNELDVWRRADLPTDAKAPVLFQVHGGAWTMGSKEGQAEPLMAHLAERGWVCVAPNYRLSPKATWPDHIVDVKRALAWVKQHVAAHGGDPDFVVITGGSAGGHLCSLAALTPGLAAFQPGFERADTSVAAAVPFYGAYDLAGIRTPADPGGTRFLAERIFKTTLEEDRARWRQASPIAQVGPDAPPFFVLHGTNDSLIDVHSARRFVDALRAASTSPVVYAELPLAQHAFESFPSVRAHHTVHAVERFLAVVRSEHGGRTPAQAVTAPA